VRSFRAWRNPTAPTCLSKIYCCPRGYATGCRKITWRIEPEEGDPNSRSRGSGNVGTRGAFRNGSIIARNVAEGLSALQPQKRAYFLANATAFKAALDKDIIRWKAELKPLRNLRIFSAQCGWQNFSKLGGPTFVVCKGDLGSLPTPEHLVDRVKEMKAQIVIVDPNTPPEYGEVFREQSGARVIEVASSIENHSGADSYSALFENLVQALQAAAKN
jgi:ABC-type Zn uptake system ZnuABC Zn-binding protein ZnuA